MKKILLSLITVVATLAVVGVGARAVFSDTDSFDGNTISTANVNISALSEPEGHLPKPLVASGLVPGQYTDWARGVIFNQADSTDVEVFMHVDGLTGVACDKTNLEVWTGHAASGASSERGTLVYDGALEDLDGPGNEVKVNVHPGLFDPTVPPNHSVVIQQRAQLDPSADNTYQNTSCTWDEVFVAKTVAP